MIRLLRALLLLMVMSAFPVESCTDGTSPDDPLDVLIIGAGWSGLAAANRLFQGNGNNNGNNDRSFCILEGRNAIGGRSRTIMGAFEPGLPTELGSAWIYRGSNVFQIFQQAGLITDVPSYFDLDNTALYADASTFAVSDGGGLLQGNQDRAVRRAYSDFVQFVRSRASPDISLQTLLDTYLTENAPSLTPLEQRAIRGLATTIMHTEFGAYMDQTNSRDMANSLTYSYTIDFVAVPGSGFKPALDYFAAPFANNHIRLNTQVLEVDYSYGDNSVVKVTSKNTLTNAASVQYTRSVLCTVSLGVLQYGEIAFVPPLPDWKTRAIQEMGMGNKNKMILYWDPSTTDVDLSSWWPTGINEMHFITTTSNNADGTTSTTTENEFEWTFFSNDQNHRGNEDNYVLTAWIGGIAADQWENRTDQEILDRVMSNLRKMFPNVAVPDPTKFVATRWKSDPFTRGTYSYYRVGVNYGETARTLAQPVGSNIYFAGEATWAGGMGAPDAFSSGERAVTWILDSGVLEQELSPIPTPPPTTTPTTQEEETTPSSPTSLPQPIQKKEAPLEAKCGSVAQQSGYGGTAAQAKGCGNRKLHNKNLRRLKGS